jgi:hypothetical protein
MAGGGHRDEGGDEGRDHLREHGESEPRGAEDVRCAVNGALVASLTVLTLSLTHRALEDRAPDLMKQGGGLY